MLCAQFLRFELTGQIATTFVLSAIIWSVLSAYVTVSRDVIFALGGLQPALASILFSVTLPSVLWLNQKARGYFLVTAHTPLHRTKDDFESMLQGTR